MELPQIEASARDPRSTAGNNANRIHYTHWRKIDAPFPSQTAKVRTLLRFPETTSAKTAIINRYPRLRACRASIKSAKWLCSPRDTRSFSGGAAPSRRWPTLWKWIQFRNAAKKRDLAMHVKIFANVRWNLAARVTIWCEKGEKDWERNKRSLFLREESVKCCSYIYYINEEDMLQINRVRNLCL